MRRRGRNLLLSPLDWALIEAWKERGIPLHVVLRALENVFETNQTQSNRNKRQIKSLLYCRDEVERLYAAWLEAQIGTAAQAKSKAEKLNLEKSESTETKQENQDFAPKSPFSTQDVLNHLQFCQQQLHKNKENLNDLWNNFVKDILHVIHQAENEFLKNFEVEKLEAVLSEADHKIDEILPKAFEPKKFAALKSQTVAQINSYKLQMSRAAFDQTFKSLLLKKLREQIDLPRLSLFYL